MELTGRGKTIKVLKRTLRGMDENGSGGRQVRRNAAYNLQTKQIISFKA